jgi:hypothetical protein
MSKSLMSISLIMFNVFLGEGYTIGVTFVVSCVLCAVLRQEDVGMVALSSHTVCLAHTVGYAVVIHHAPSPVHQQFCSSSD